ncbi:MAG: T9SS type A sorting domain-containing protein [Fibrobacteres bacterium]|nr:T9SS type A sorting domain-containing protein [Fibrobacterota bacterium]
MKKFLLTFVLLAAVAIQAQSWLDPANFPNSTLCDTTGTGLGAKYIQCWRANPAPMYTIRTTPLITGTNPARYKSPVIDGTLENDIWSNAETLLVNSWEDAGKDAACGDNKKFTGSSDLHAIWRFCYNHYGMYVSCEVHDDIWDVDSLSGWFLQDGIEIAIDPFDWGDYGKGLWNEGIPPAANSFRRYFSNNQQIITKPDGSHENFFHILRRAVDEPAITGLIKGVHKANYNLGKERTNFMLGDAACQGIVFATKLQGVDAWGRAIIHHEFKFPYHGSLWATLSEPGRGYFNEQTVLGDNAKLPQQGVVFKVDIGNNDDDISGPNGASPNNHQLGRRRGGDFSSENTHWSDTKYFMAFRYAGTQERKIVDVVTGQSNHGYPGIIGSWVDSLTEKIRYDFTAPGTIKIGNTIYYYDSIPGSGPIVNGKLMTVKSGADTGTFAFKKHATNNFLDELTVTVNGQQPIKMLRSFTTGFTELSNTRWLKARLEVAGDCQNGYADSVLSPLSAAQGGREFRFVALSTLTDSLMPAKYKDCTDSLRIYVSGTDSVLDRMTYIAKPKQLVRDRYTTPYASYDIKAVSKADNNNAQTALIVKYNAGGIDTFVKVANMNTMRFGETKTTYVGDAATSVNDQIYMYPIDKWDIAWRVIIKKYSPADSGAQIEILDREWSNAVDSGVARGKIPVKGKLYTSMLTYQATWNGPSLDGYIMSVNTTDSTKPLLGNRLYSCELRTDTVILQGYTGDTANPGTVTRVQKPYNQFAPNNAWVEQTVTFVLKKGALSDTYVFKDTTQVKHWPFVKGVPFSTGTSVFNVIDTSSSNLCPKISAEGNVNAIQVFDAEVYPNPANPATIIKVSVPASMAGSDISLNIYNIRGQLVRTLLKSNVTKAGFTKRVLWEGENNLGNKVSSGLYYYRLNAGKKTLKGTIVMMK